jgi:hypothetical protein
MNVPLLAGEGSTGVPEEGPTGVAGDSAIVDPGLKENMIQAPSNTFMQYSIADIHFS